MLVSIPYYVNLVSPCAPTQDPELVHIEDGAFENCRGLIGDLVIPALE